MVVAFELFNQTEKYGYTSVISLFNSLRQRYAYTIPHEEIVSPWDRNRNSSALSFLSKLVQTDSVNKYKHKI